MNDETFEEQRQFLVSRLDLITYGLFFLIVVGLSTYFLVAYTPIRESIPGYPNVAEQQAMVERDLKNLEYLQQLEHFAEIEALYHQNVAAVLKDQLPVDPTNSDSVVLDSVDFSNLNLEGSEEDSLLRIKIDEREKYSLMAKDDVKDRDRMRGVYFFSPINGSVSQKFDSKSKHFGVDIVAPKDEAIKATLDGTIMFTEWTYESGYVLHIQHSHNLVSVYKHNSFLLKKTGEVVKAGDPIAIIGIPENIQAGLICILNCGMREFQSILKSILDFRKM